MKLNLLPQEVSKHFSIHPSRQKTLSAMIFGVLSTANVHHQSLSRYVESPNPKAALRKVERFFVKNPFLPKIMPRPLLNSLDLKANLTFA